MRTGLGDFSPIAGQTAKLSGRHTEEQIRSTFIELGNSYRCLALFTPVLKGFSSNSQARGKDSPCPRKGQIPSPEKSPKKRPRGARLITVKNAHFCAGKAIISLWPTKNYQEIEQNGSDRRRARTEWEALGELDELDRCQIALSFTQNQEFSVDQMLLSRSKIFANYLLII